MISTYYDWCYRNQSDEYFSKFKKKELAFLQEVEAEKFEDKVKQLMQGSQKMAREQKRKQLSYMG